MEEVRTIRCLFILRCLLNISWRPIDWHTVLCDVRAYYCLHEVALFAGERWKDNEKPRVFALLSLETQSR